MNILILNWRDPKNPKSGGAEIVTLEHAKAWVKAGHTVVWFTSQFPHAKEKEVIDGVKIVRKGSAYSVFFYATFFYYASKKKYDVIIDEIHGIPFFTPLYVRNTKIIAFIHEVAGEIWDYMYPFPLNVIGKIFEKFYFKFYKNVPFWTDAPSTINELEEKGIKKENCIAIPCPINNAVVKKMPIKEKKPTYIFVCRLVKMKGIEEIIKTFVLIKQVQKNAQLWLVGGGEEQYVLRLKALLCEKGIGQAVTFYGFVPNQIKLELLGKAHLLLHASVKEGWGLVVLEAASQGTPSIVYNVSGLRDSVQHNKTGLVILHNTPEQLAKNALWLLKNKAEYYKMQKAGIVYAKKLVWSTVTKESLNYINRS